MSVLTHAVAIAASVAAPRSDPAPAVETPAPAVETAAPAADLADKGAVPLEFGIGVRFVFRPTARDNATFDGPASDAEWQLPQAIRLSGDARYGPLRLVAQLQDVRSWGESPSTLSEHAFTGAHQGYLELSGEGLGRKSNVTPLLRVGRQEIVLWTGRLLGEAPWQPGMRAFDAARVRVDVGRFGLESGAAVLRFARTISTEGPGGDPPVSVRTSGDQLYWGEATAKVHPAIELHAITFLLRQGPDESELDRDRALLVPGGYAHGQPATGLTYDLEAYGQLGKDNVRRHRAWAAIASVAYQAEVPLRPQVAVTYEIASGSACTNPTGDPAGCGESTVRDFDQLYGRRHGVRGFADLFALTNVRDLAIGQTLSPARAFDFRVDYHWLGLQETSGRWVRTSGANVGRGWDPDNTAHTLGHEIDIMLSYQPWEALHLRPGYSVFVPTSAGLELGGPDPMHFVYLWIVSEIGHRFRVR